MSALMACSAPNPLAAEEGEIHLRIDGAAGTPFVGTCELKSEAGNKTLIIDQRAPFRATYQGASLHCRITAYANIEIEAVKGGSRSFSSVSGGTVDVNIGP